MYIIMLNKACLNNFPADRRVHLGFKRENPCRRSSFLGLRSVYPGGQLEIMLVCILNGDEFGGKTEFCRLVGGKHACSRLTDLLLFFSFLLPTIAFATLFGQGYVPNILLCDKYRSSTKTIDTL